MPKAKATPKKPAAPKPTVDKKAIKMLKKANGQIAKFVKRVGKKQSKHNLRAKHGTEILGLLERMLKDEKAGWTDLK